MLGVVNAQTKDQLKATDVKTLNDRIQGVKTIVYIGVNLTWINHGVQIDLFNNDLVAPILVQRWTWSIQHQTWFYDGDITLAPGVTEVFDKQAHPNTQYGYLASQWLYQ